MSEYNKFLDHVYSDELITVDPDEFDEVQQLMAEEGHHDFSIELEQQLDEQEAWKSSKQFNEVLIKKACEHSDCPHTRCAKSQRIGGIEI